MTGIDISGVQPENVPGDWEFIVTKLSEGVNTPNTRVNAQWANAARTTRGFYHYARPAFSSGYVQANFFCDQALARGFRPGVDIWQLDAENGENEMVGAAQWRVFILNFMHVALARLGKRGFLYAGFPFVEQHGIGDLLYTFMWWLPDYGPDNSLEDHGLSHLRVDLPGLVVIHQYTSFGGLDRNTIVNHIAYGQIGVPPVTAPQVPQEYHPALVIAAVLRHPATPNEPLPPVLAAVQPDGSILAWGITFCRGMNGDPDFAGREAAELVWPNAAEQAAGCLYTIVDTGGNRYALHPAK